MYAVIRSRVGFRRCAVLPTCSCVLVSPTNERKLLSYRRHISLCTLRLLCTLPCNLHMPCYWLHPTLDTTDIANSAPFRTIQAQIHIVRVPAVVPVLWLDTYPHYRGHPTV